LAKIDEDKDKFRKTVRRIADTFGHLNMTEWSGEIAERVFTLPEYKAAKTIFTFIGVDSEVDTRPIIQRAILEGKRVAVPRTFGKGIMVPCEIMGLHDLIPGRYGIPEPQDDAPEVLLGEGDLILVPCLACDLEGMRIGHGAGYYDRLLAGSKAFKAILCFDALVVEDIPYDEHDIRSDMVITEKRLARTGKGSEQHEAI
jgi:5-formyltetrahydrofolate cyclo-ligase